jgi:hypothetical protein
MYYFHLYYSYPFCKFFSNFNLHRTENEKSKSIFLYRTNSTDITNKAFAAVVLIDLLGTNQVCIILIHRTENEKSKSIFSAPKPHK